MDDGYRSGSLADAIVVGGAWRTLTHAGLFGSEGCRAADVANLAQIVVAGGAGPEALRAHEESADGARVHTVSIVLELVGWAAGGTHAYSVLHFESSAAYDAERGIEAAHAVG